MLEFLQLNGHKSKCVSMTLINELLRETAGQVMLLQEPYCYKDRPACLGRSLQIVTGSGAPPRPAIAATRDVPLWFLQDYSGPNMTTALIQNETDSIYVLSLIHI